MLFAAVFIGARRVGGAPSPKALVRVQLTILVF